jgi:hypothetical protein
MADGTLRKLLITVIALLPITHPSAAQDVADCGDAMVAKTYNVAEAYQVYSALLPDEWPRLIPAQTLMISDKTSTYGMCLQPEPESSKVLGTAIADYVATNKRSRTLQRSFQIDKPYELIPEQDLHLTSNAADGWSTFYKRHPNAGGWIELSAVGFNNEKTVAIVYVARHCGVRCGGGGFHVLQKHDGKWVRLEWKGVSCFWQS